MPDTDASTDVTATNPTATDTGASADTATEETVDWKAEAEKFKALARKHEDRAKANANAVKELDEARRQNLTDQERMVEDARAQTRAEILAEFGSKLVQAEFRAAATGRMSDESLATLLEGVNLSRFVLEDGSVDSAAVARFVDGIAPKAADAGARPFPDLGQGARPDMSMALNGDPLLNAVKSKLGIS